MKLNKAKARGEDKIPRKTWEYMDGGTRQKMINLFKRLWGEEGTPQECRTGIISSLCKKETGRR